MGVTSGNLKELMCSAGSRIWPAAVVSREDLDWFQISIASTDTPTYFCHVKLRFYIDADTNGPHIVRHQVSEEEVADVLERPLEDRSGAEGARVAIGQTRGGRYLRVIYVPDPEPDSVFVITAYELGPNAKRALQRRRRKKT